MIVKDKSNEVRGTSQITALNDSSQGVLPKRLLSWRNARSQQMIFSSVASSSTGGRAPVPFRSSSAALETQSPQLDKTERERAKQMLEDIERSVRDN